MLRVAALLVALVPLACDPWPSDDGDDDEAPWTPPPPPPSPARKAAPAGPTTPGALGGFVDCLARCDAPGRTRAERAECRYRCDGGERPSDAAGPAAVDPVEAVVHCMNRCPIRGRRRDACMDACERLAVDSPASPSRAVLDRLGVCIDECRRQRPVKSIDRATCELACVEVARTAGPGPSSPP